MEKQEFSIKNEVFDWLEAICISIVTIVLVFSFFFRFASVEGNSMLPTLHSKDKVVLLNTWISDIKEGDVVVITQPTSVGQPIIKRVIATEGQTIDIDYKTGNVYVDGILIEEPYIREKIRFQANNPVNYPFTVSKDHVFVMGDNRNDSSDSREAGIGEIDTRYILGKAILRVFPTNSFGFIK